MYTSVLPIIAMLACHKMDLLGEEDDGLYIRDIMRGGIGNDDERISRNMAE